MALIKTISLRLTRKYRTVISLLLVIIPTSLLAQETKVYRVKRSGETASPSTLPQAAPSVPEPEKQGIRVIDAKPPQEETKVYHWQQSRARTVRRHQQLVHPQNYVNHEVLGEVLKKYVTKSEWVNYRGLKRDPEAQAKLAAYIQDLSEMNPSTFEDPMDRLASWLNLYNAMVLQEILKHYPVKSLMQIPNFFGKPRFKVGDKTYSILEIEQTVFKQEVLEPRAVFARVNGASSGPRLMRKPFNPVHLDKQLEDRTWKFLLDRKNVNFDPNRKALILNPTFLWYQQELGDLLAFLRTYLDLLPKYFVLNYTGYDWKINDEKLH